MQSGAADQLPCPGFAGLAGEDAAASLATFRMYLFEYLNRQLFNIMNGKKQNVDDNMNTHF